MIPIFKNCTHIQIDTLVQHGKSLEGYKNLTVVIFVENRVERRTYFLFISHASQLFEFKGMHTFVIRK